MFDKKIRSKIDKYLDRIAYPLSKKGIQANQVTVFGFLIGLMALPLISFQYYLYALICILLNRLCDGLDGSLARQTKVTDTGAYLDIVLDFIFYSSVVFGFALAQPQNAIYAALLIFSFIGTGSSFLAFAIFAEKLDLNDAPTIKDDLHELPEGRDKPKFFTIKEVKKSFYYLGGLAEGTETIIILCLMCLFPEYFWLLALGFALICFLATFLRIRQSLSLLK